MLLQVLNVSQNRHCSGSNLLKTLDFCALMTAIALNRSLLDFESHSCETEMLILRDKVYFFDPS